MNKQVDDRTEAGAFLHPLAGIPALCDQGPLHHYTGLLESMLSLIWGARRGLTLHEIVDLFKAEQDAPVADWALIFNALGGKLINRGGIWTFANESFRSSVQQWYLPDRNSRDIARIKLALYFEAQPINERTCDELPWLLKQTESFERLRNCLLTIDRFVFINERNQYEWLQYWVDMKEEQNMGQYYLETFASLESAGGVPPVALANDAKQLGSFHLCAGLYASAERFYRRALELFEQELGPTHSDTLEAVNDLALLLNYQGDYAAATALCLRAWEGFKRTLGPFHAYTLKSANNLAVVKYNENDVATAMQLYRWVLDGFERTLGKSDPDALTCIGNLARLHYMQGDLNAAHAFYRKARAGFEETLGPDHPQTLLSVSNLARYYYDQGDYAAAEPLFRRALTGCERQLGAYHPDTLLNVSNLAGLLFHRGDVGAAESLYDRALHGFEKALGRNHPLTLASVDNLAKFQEWRGRYATAEQLYSRALEGYRSAFGPSHPYTLNAKHDLTLLQTKKADKALTPIGN
ncbi:MAG: tetratricopeptide repeat protein [Methylomonas sp.]|jgi:tetratricopeptide (TPR) repeat protein